MAMKGPLHTLFILNCMVIAKCSTFNACLLHHVNITSKPVIITSSSKEDVIDDCVLDLYVQEENAIFVEILRVRTVSKRISKIAHV